MSDDDRDRIYEVNPGPDGRHGTADDVVTTINTRLFNSLDPEGVAYAPSLDELFIVDGFNREVYRLSPGVNGRFDGVAPDGDDAVHVLGLEDFGIRDPEGIVFDELRGSLLISDRGARVFELAPSGSLVGIIELTGAGSLAGAGITVAPRSDDARERSLYVVVRGVDNDTDPDENDGKMYEFAFDSLTLNQAPEVDAGPDQTVSVNDEVMLLGEVIDDGLAESTIAGARLDKSERSGARGL